MRDWLGNGAAIPKDTELYDDLIGPEYGFTTKEQFQLESKEDMKNRDLQSPDCADALAITFAYPVIHRKHPLSRFAKRAGKAETEYDLFGRSEMQ